MGLGQFGIGGWAIFKLLFGISVGIAQWLVLRPRVDVSALWVTATALAGAVGGGVALIMNQVIDWASFAIVFGTASGILQWLFLKRKVTFANWWIGANILGGILGGIAGPPLCVTLFTMVFSNAIIESGYVFGTLAGAGFGIVFGLVTGIPLAANLKAENNI